MTLITEGDDLNMIKRRFSLALCIGLCLISLSLKAHAQTTPADSSDETNLETQLFLIVGSNLDVADARLPTSLDTVIKQLRTTLPFKNYRLAATLINRVKNEGRLELSWVGGPLASPSGAATASTPSFSQFRVQQVKLIRNSEGQQIVRMQGFNFGARFPIQTTGAIAANGAVAPVFNYENTGLATDISMREAEPVVVGTLNVGPSGDAIILVVSARRTQK